MTFPTARTALQGNPPTPGYSPRKADIVNVLEQMQAIAAVQMLRDFHGALEDLPTGGNETGDKRAVLAPEAEGGGVYRWDGATWDLVSALPVVLTQSLSAELAQAWAEGTAPGGSGTRSAREWAMVSGNNGRLEIGTVTTLDAGEAATATITGPTGEQELNLGIPDGVDGWSPQLALVSDGARRVLQVIDWTGGEGEKPATGLYVGPAGLIADVATATDIRGIPGEGDMSTPVYDPQGIGADVFNASNMESGNLPMARTPTLTATSTAGALMGRNQTSGAGPAVEISVPSSQGLFIGASTMGLVTIPLSLLTDPTSTQQGGITGERFRQAADDYAEKFLQGPELLVPATGVPASGSGQIDIPEWANEIEVILREVTWTRNDYVMVQVGTASAWITSGYVSSSAAGTITNGLGTRGASSGDSRWGTSFLRSITTARSIWQWHGSERTNASFAHVYNGSTPDLSGPLTRIRIVGRGGAGTLAGAYAVIVRR